MVYESDFYTTRRPYSTYRPSATSYSVTTFPINYITPTGKVHTLSSYYPSSHIPLRSGGVTRLVTSSAAPHHLITVRVRPAVILRELDRIANRRRPALAYQPSEDFLCSESSKRWEDETRKIRAQTSALLQKCHASVPRASSVVPFHALTSYGEPLIPVRFTSDDYIRRLLLPIRNVANDIRSISWYAAPASKFTGRGHLSCLNYTGNKAFPKRRPLCQDFTVRDDINLLSFYVKNRLAAAGLAAEFQTVKLLPWRPTRKFQKPMLMEDPALELKASKAERLERFNTTSKITEVDSGEADKLAERKKKRQEEAKLAEERAIVEEAARRKELSKRDEEARAAELARQEELAAQAAAERAAELERKAELTRRAELEAKKASEARRAEELRKAEEERLAEEEQRNKELARLEELERQAEEEKEAELARQASELAEIARQQAELDELARQQAELDELARQQAELDELARQQAELDELARQQAELDELARQEAELEENARQEAELEELRRQEAELAALDAEAKALAEGSDAPHESAEENDEPEVDPPLAKEDDEDSEQPIVDEPETPEAQKDDEGSEPDAEADVTDDENE